MSFQRRRQRSGINSIKYHTRDGSEKKHKKTSQTRKPRGQAISQQVITRLLGTDKKHNKDNLET